MLTIRQPEPVKVFAGVFWSDAAAHDLAEQAMVSLWGACDLRSSVSSFSFTDYYDAEMGAGLQRSFLGFETLMPPSDLPRLKLQANDIERRSTVNGRRRVNIDVGYLDYHKVVLASTKEGPCKIYLDDGIWADMTLRYSKGGFLPFEWTFLDFRTGTHDRFLLELRSRYKSQLRAGDRS